MARGARCRFHEVPVPILASDATTPTVVEHLAALELQPLVLDSTADAFGLPREAFPCLLEFDGSRGHERRPSGLDQLRSIVLRRVGLPVVVLVLEPPDRQTAADLRGISPSWNVQILRWPSAEERLVKRVITCRFRIWLSELEHEITAASHVDRWVRSALGAVMRLRVPPPRSPGSAPARTIKGAAEGLGCSPAWLSQVMRSAGAGLPEVADARVALDLLFQHEVEEAAWESLALAAGYSGISGLSELMFRVFGRRPRKLSGGGIEVGLRRIEGLVRPRIAP